MFKKSVKGSYRVLEMKYDFEEEEEKVNTGKGIFGFLKGFINYFVGTKKS